MLQKVTVPKLVMVLYLVLHCILHCCQPFSSGWKVKWETTSVDGSKWQLSHQQLFVILHQSHFCHCLPEPFLKVLSILLLRHCLSDLNGARVKASAHLCRHWHCRHWRRQFWQSILEAKHGNKNTLIVKLRQGGFNINSPHPSCRDVTVFFPALWPPAMTWARAGKHHSMVAVVPLSSRLLNILCLLSRRKYGGWQKVDWVTK